MRMLWLGEMCGMGLGVAAIFGGLYYVSWGRLLVYGSTMLASGVLLFGVTFAHWISRVTGSPLR